MPDPTSGHTDAIKIKELPARIRRQAVMVVERRWTVPELPEIGELLDTPGHCYGFLADVVREDTNSLR